MLNDYNVPDIFPQDLFSIMGEAPDSLQCCLRRPQDSQSDAL